MRIYTHPIIKNASVINKMYDGNNPLTSTMFMDFENQTAYVRNENGSHVQMPIKSDENDLDLSSITVDSKKFLTICEFYQDDDDFLELVDVGEDSPIYVFYHGKEEYRISPQVDERIFDRSIFDTEESEDSFVVEEDFFNRLKTSTHYNNDMIPGVHIYENKMISVGGSSYYFKVLTQEVPDIVLNDDTVDFILQASVGATVSLFDDFVRIDKSNGTSFIIPTNENRELFVDVFSDKFKEAYSHESFIKLRYANFITFLNSLSPFASETEFSVAQFIIDNNSLTIKIDSDTTSIKRNFDLESSEGEFDFEIFISVSELVKNLKNLDKNDFVVIELSNKTIINSKGKEKETVLFSMWGADKDNEYIVQKRLIG